MNIVELLSFAVKNKASDLHLSAGMAPMIRVHGEIRKNQPASHGAQRRSRNGVRHHE